MTPRERDRLVVRRALHGPLTAEKRAATAMGVSRTVKSAVKNTITQNKKALRALAHY